MLLLGAAWLVASEASAETGPPVSEAAPARTEVVLGTVGVEAGPARSSLVTLLEGELGRANLSLMQREAREPLSRWADETARSKRVLVVLLLDGRNADWRLIVIDAARNRAIARDLRGGLDQDAASIEAVVSIAVSAATALREGLEIASSPVAAVVGDPPPSHVQAAQNETAHRAATKPRTAQRAESSARASLSATLSSFSSAAPTTEGLSLALGARFRALAEARVTGALFAPAQIGTPLGEFQVSRGWIAASAGPVFGNRSFSLTPEAGVVVERLRRFDATPAAGVAETDAAALYRVGGSLSLRLRHTLVGPLSGELVTGAVYFGRRVRFSAKSADSSWSVDAWPALAFGQLGLEMAFE